MFNYITYLSSNFRIIRKVYKLLIVQRDKIDA